MILSCWFLDQDIAAETISKDIIVESYAVEHAFPLALSQALIKQVCGGKLSAKDLSLQFIHRQSPGLLESDHNQCVGHDTSALVGGNLS